MGSGERLASLVALGEADGGTWNWDRMDWKK
jgi:hypothetical protein